MIDYILNPILMGGLVKEVHDGQVKLHLHGRLGVITIPEELILTKEPVMPGLELEFYFSYVQVTAAPLDYDTSPLHGKDEELIPCLIGGHIIEVNDTAIKASLDEGLGTVAVPLRWVFTDMALEEGQCVELYFSRVRPKPVR